MDCEAQGLSFLELIVNLGMICLHQFDVNILDVKFPSF